jgi:hypothetical protein
MTEEAGQPVARPHRRITRGVRRLWSVTADDASVEDQAAQIVRDTDQLKLRLKNVAIWIDIGLLICSAAATIVGHYVDLDALAAVGLISTLLFAFPTTRDTREAWRRAKGSNSAGSGKSWVARVVELTARTIQRRRLNRLFAQFGRQEIAARVIDPDKQWYTVRAQARRRRTVQLSVAAVAVSIVAVLGAGVLFFTQRFHDLSIGEEFSLGDFFALSVKGAPACKEAGETGLEDTCSLPIAVRNKTENPIGLGAGSFGAIYSWGPYYQLYDGPPLDYATSLHGPNGYYIYSTSTPNLASSDMIPKGMVHESLLYKVKFGTKIDEVQLAVRGERIRIRVRFTEQ